MTFPLFGLPHLSEDAVAAYADGVLSPAAMIRAEKHCLECAECAEAVRVQREAVSMLRTVAAPQVPSGLMDRLAALPTSAPMPPPWGGLPTAVGEDGTPVFLTHRPRPHDGVAHRSRMRVVVPVGVLASAAAVVAVSAVAATLGSGPDRRPSDNAPAFIAPIVQASTITGGSQTTPPTAPDFSAVQVHRAPSTP